jgi:ATP phosphoribosyltransferase regulatory subunit
LSFILLTAKARGELGRGGRYLTEAAESATGFTLYTDTLLRALPRPQGGRRLLIGPELPAGEADRLRREGWITVAALSQESDLTAEARRLGCGHVWTDGAARPIDSSDKHR